MYHFWSTFIEPIIKIVAPKVIVEIGAEDGNNTVNIVKYCRANNACCHVIDPVPIKRLAELKDDFNKCWTYHQGLSLDILPSLEPAGVYLIDGDHNWYTVFNELSEILRKHIDVKIPLPVIMFHDIGWPYGRRDMYYNPKNIPAKYLQPNDKIGIMPNFAKVTTEGLNSHLYNALVEGGPRNGVLTAIEDFLQSVPGVYQLQSVPGMHGLGVLVPENLSKEKKISILSSLNDIENLKAHLVGTENMRFTAEQANELSALNKKKETLALTSKMEILEKQLEKREDIAREFRTVAQQKQNYINSLNSFIPSWMGIVVYKFYKKIRNVAVRGYRFYRLKGFREFVFLAPLFVLRRGHVYSDDPNFDAFIMIHRLSGRVRSGIKREIGSFKSKPLISIIVPTFNTPPKYLRKCILSVKKQLYPNWELCIYDDASQNQSTIREIKYWESRDPRIKIKFGDENQHISGASNEAIKMTSGDFVGLLDHDDELSPDALFEVVKRLNEQPDLDLIYSDEDKLEENGKRSDHHFKPDFNLDYLLSICYIGHFAVIRKSLGDQIGWLRKGYEGSQDHDLFIRLADKTARISHIPKILYHWRKIRGSTASSSKQKDYYVNASRRAISDYLKRNNIDGKVETVNIGIPTYRIKRKIIKNELVSIIIPFKDKVDYLRSCVNSIIEKTTYPNYELILVSNNSKEDETFNYLKWASKKYENVNWFEYNVPFNYSQINNWATSKAQGPYILFLNNDTEIIDGDWLNAMVEHIQRPEVGAVGAKLLYSDKTVQHAGVILGLGSVAGHAHKRFKSYEPGYAARLQTIQGLSGVTAACLLTKLKVHKAIGGFNEKDLAVAFNDVDYGLKIRKMGLSIIYTPFACIFHHESISRGFDTTREKKLRASKEAKYMKKIWGDKLYSDPAYNTNLTLAAEDFSIKKVYEFIKEEELSLGK